MKVSAIVPVLSLLSVASAAQFFIYAIKQSDSGVYQRRLDAQEAHLAHALQLEKDGILLTGGPVLLKESLTNPNLTDKFYASFFAVETEDIEGAWKTVTDNSYWTGNVWDKKKTTVLPYQQYFPTGGF
ncbi:hypothetical protein BT69DRAFT_1300504 [Atractiella rhizophila]|nr:hypothetical protein BT69DRAFT_1300504 [Atractiella rhizophila]